MVGTCEPEQIVSWYILHSLSKKSSFCKNINMICQNQNRKTETAFKNHLDWFSGVDLIGQSKQTARNGWRW